MLPQVAVVLCDSRSEEYPFQRLPNNYYKETISMSSPRKSIALSIGKEVPPVEEYKAQPGQAIYGSLVFNDAAQKQFLSKDVYKKLRATTLRGEPLDPSIADQVAQGMKEWA